LNCPACSAPLLFGSTSCSCGFQRSRSEDRPLEISYWEAFRVWWRIYWPTQLLSIVLLAAGSIWLGRYVNAWRVAHPLQRFPLKGYLPAIAFLMPVLTGSVGLWLFTPRIVGRPYRGFRLVACMVSGESGSRLTARQRAELWFFVWWRQFAGGLLALLLAGPLNMLLGTMRINASSQIAALMGLFAIGPIIMKMLVGHRLTGFQIEARRSLSQALPAEASTAGL
jgi:hypothetical protein